MKPNNNEKELFPVIVHEDQFVVPARRIHHLLQVPVSFAEWMADLCLRSVVELGVDYYERPGSDVVFSIYAIQKITASDSFADDDAGHATRAKIVFKYCSSLQHHLVHVAMKSMGSYLATNLSWRSRQGHKLFKLSSVLKSLEQPNAQHWQQRFPQHFTRFNGTTYISVEVAELMHMRKWLDNTEAFLLDINPWKDTVH